jgi:hypothetical protein
MEYMPLGLTIYEHRAYGPPSRQLELRCKVGHSSPLPIYIQDAWIKIEALNGLLIAEGRLFYTLNAFAKSAVIPVADQGDANIVIPLSPTALQQIEHRRAGKDLILKIGSRVRAFLLHEQGNMNVLGTPFETQFDHGHTGSVEYKIPQSEWIKVLSGLAWSELELLELPSTKIATSPQLSRAYERFKDAEEFFHRGDWEESMASCNKAFEAMIKDATGEDDISSAKALDALQSLVTAPEKAVHINNIIKSFKPFLHMSRHEQKPPIPIKSKDAMLALHITGSMLSYLSGE